VVAPGNRNEAPLLREALPEVMRILREVGMDLCGTIVSLDSVYQLVAGVRDEVRTCWNWSERMGPPPFMKSAVVRRWPNIHHG
jgi:hypothetical protein